MVLDHLQPDRFIWKWLLDGRYSASSAYRAFFSRSSSLLGAKELWQTKAPPKVKFFGWLALHGHIWTVERRMRHGLQDSDTCVLYMQASETVGHLFFGCVLARQLWFRLLQPLGLAALTPDREVGLDDWWLELHCRLDPSARPIFDSCLQLVV